MANPISVTVTACPASILIEPMGTLNVALVSEHEGIFETLPTQIIHWATQLVIILISDGIVIIIQPLAATASSAVKVIFIVTPEAVTELLDSWPDIDEALIGLASRVTPAELLVPTRPLVSLEQQQVSEKLEVVSALPLLTTDPIVKLQIPGVIVELLRFLIKTVFVPFIVHVILPAELKLVLETQLAEIESVSSDGNLTWIIELLSILSNVVTINVQLVFLFILELAAPTVAMYVLAVALIVARPCILSPPVDVYTWKVKGSVVLVLGGAVYLPIVMVQTVPANRVGLVEACRMMRVRLVELNVTPLENRFKFDEAMATKLKVVPAGNVSWKQSDLDIVSASVKLKMREVKLLIQRGELEVARATERD